MQYQRHLNGKPTHPKRDSYSAAANDGKSFLVSDDKSLAVAMRATEGVTIKEFEGT